MNNKNDAMTSTRIIAVESAEMHTLRIVPHAGVRRMLRCGSSGVSPDGDLDRKYYAESG